MILSLPISFFPFIIFLFFCLTIYFTYYLRALFRIAYRLASYLPKKYNIPQKISQIKEAYNKRTMTISLLLALFGFIIIYFQGYLLILGLWGNISLKTAVFSFPIISLAKTIPITIAGLGLREGTAILLFTNFGVSKEIAMNMAILWFVMDILVPGIIGLASIPFFRKNLCKDREA